MSETTNEGAEPQSQQPQLRIERMYLKDASFESPGTPSIFSEQWRPETQVDINTTVNNLGDNRHEVVLAVTVTSKRDGDRVAFVAEVHYAGIFVINGLDAQQLHQVIGIACPNTLFPYVRENLDSLVVRGGFPAMQLAQVNFEALYAQAMQKANKKDDAPVQH
ncbi:MAG: protein-export chaperone SecB [Pseudomonadales bacterium]|jgi:preprotein translocase subunit SecB|nr:protein-export chaperone SecB [Pseudomonadales bacterium]